MNTESLGQGLKRASKVGARVVAAGLVVGTLSIGKDGAKPVASQSQQIPSGNQVLHATEIPPDVQYDRLSFLTGLDGGVASFTWGNFTNPDRTDLIASGSRGGSVIISQDKFGPHIPPDFDQSPQPGDLAGLPACRVYNSQEEREDLVFFNDYRRNFTISHYDIKTGKVVNRTFDYESLGHRTSDISKACLNIDSDPDTEIILSINEREYIWAHQAYIMEPFEQNPKLKKFPTSSRGEEMSEFAGAMLGDYNADGIKDLFFPGLFHDMKYYERNWGIHLDSYAVAFEPVSKLPVT